MRGRKPGLEIFMALGMRTQWRRTKIVFIAAALAAAAVGGFMIVRTTGSVAGDERVGPAPTVRNPANAEDEKAITQTQAAYLKAFKAGDAKALAACWTTDGEFVDAAGKAFHGRAAIEKEFAAFFKESQGLTLAISMDSLRFVGPGVALESGSARVTGATEGAGSTTAYSIVHTKRDGKWLLASVRELPYAPASNFEHLRDLEWLVGSWTAKNGGQTLQLTCEWTAKRNFLTRKYVLTAADGTVKTGLQIIGWDPQASRIRSWVFDSDGGFGSELWSKDGKRWVLEATAVTREGGEAVATNVLTRIDHDSFQWQSIERTLNEVRVPDTAPIKATRVKAAK
jgi:uncharacterized protein (TIGR02246 family)